MSYQGVLHYSIRNLKDEGFCADHAANGEEGLDLALTRSYDAAIVDIMLPRLDGLSLIEQLRRKGINTPVITLSAKRSVDDRIRGLQKGGDDDLTKPFAFSELLARLQALMRRAAGGTEPARFKAGDLECVTQFQRGGMEGLQEEVEFEKQATGRNSFIVLLATPGNKTIFLNIPDEWKRSWPLFVSSSS